MNEKSSVDDHIESLAPFIRERVAEARERDEEKGDNIILLHGFEGAMIGTVRMPDGKERAVYEEGLCLKLVVDRIRTDYPERPESDLYMDAVDFWDNDVVRAFPYMGACAPMIIQGFEVDEDKWRPMLGT